MEVSKTLKNPKVKSKPTPPIEHLYELNEFTNEVPKIIEIIQKIKNELRISHFSEVTEKLSSVLEKITAKDDSISKLLVFSEHLFNSSKSNDNVQ